jgi:hypothetical protein
MTSKKRKRPQVEPRGLPQVEERSIPKKNRANAPIMEKSIEKNEERRTCYICREKGHSSFCTIGTSFNLSIIDDVYSLRKNEVGNMLTKYVGVQSGFIKRTI